MAYQHLAFNWAQNACKTPRGVYYRFAPGSDSDGLTIADHVEVVIFAVQETTNFFDLFAAATNKLDIKTKYSVATAYGKQLRITAVTRYPTSNNLHPTSQGVLVVPNGLCLITSHANFGSVNQVRSGSATFSEFGTNGVKLVGVTSGNSSTSVTTLNRLIQGPFVAQGGPTSTVQPTTATTATFFGMPGHVGDRLKRFTMYQPTNAVMRWFKESDPLIVHGWSGWDLEYTNNPNTGTINPVKHVARVFMRLHLNKYYRCAVDGAWGGNQEQAATALLPFADGDHVFAVPTS